MSFVYVTSVIQVASLIMVESKMNTKVRERIQRIFWLALGTNKRISTIMVRRFLCRIPRIRKNRTKVCGEHVSSFNQTCNENNSYTWYVSTIALDVVSIFCSVFLDSMHYNPMEVENLTRIQNKIGSNQLRSKLYQNDKWNMEKWNIEFDRYLHPRTASSCHHRSGYQRDVRIWRQLGSWAVGRKRSKN